MGLVRVREGKGTPLVLLPGLREDSSGWLPALPALAARHHVILLDLPGFGAAPPLPRGVLPTSRALAQEVAAELHRLGVARPHVAGFSLGGRSGWSWPGAATPDLSWRSRRTAPALRSSRAI